MIRTFGADAVTAALPFDRLVPALQRAFRTLAVSPQRHRHDLPGGAALLLMPAWQGDWLGAKIVTVHPDNAARGLDAVHSSYLLSRASTGEPVALIDGDALTARRTAAASALAASFLSRPGASRLLLLGAGRVASLLPEAHRAVRPIAEVMVWNRGAARRDELVGHLCAAGLEARAVHDLPQAAAAADIISCATLSLTPLVEGAWLRPGTHLDLVGAFTPAMREADPAALNGASVYADTAAALAECGELAGWTETQLAGTLATLCAAGSDRHHADGRTVFKSVGSAIEDLAAAAMVAEAS